MINTAQKSNNPETFIFEAIENWMKLPQGIEIKEVTGVAVDSRDYVYVANPGLYPVYVFDSRGNFVKCWGKGLFTRIHGIHIVHI